MQAFAGIVTVSVGHCHPKVVQAVDRQNHLLQHTTNIYLNNEIAEYAQELTAKLPGKLNVSLACICVCCSLRRACPLISLVVGCLPLLSLKMNAITDGSVHFSTSFLSVTKHLLQKQANIAAAWLLDLLLSCAGCLLCELRKRSKRHGNLDG